MGMGVVEGFTIDVEGTVQPFVDEDLASDLAQPRLFRNLVAHERRVKQGAARSMNPDQRTLVFSRRYLGRPEEVCFEIKWPPTELPLKLWEFLSALTKEHKRPLQGVACRG